jgi:hypothetical protein
MEVGDWVEGPAALLQVNFPPLPVEEGAGWIAETVWTLSPLPGIELRFLKGLAFSLDTVPNWAISGFKKNIIVPEKNWKASLELYLME